MPKLRDRSTVAARLYLKRSGYYADFRDYKQAGGGQEALVPPGQTRATADLATARTLAGLRLEDLKDRQARIPSHSPIPGTFEAVASLHLVRKAQLREAGAQWLESAEGHLQFAMDYFGADRHLATIKRADLNDFRDALTAHSNGRLGTLSSGSVHHYLNSLSNLFANAFSDELIPANPFAGWKRRLAITRKRTDWLEVHEMADLLRQAKAMQHRGKQSVPFFFEILATFALTGAREDEILGLCVADVDLQKGLIHITPNTLRPSLKTENADRWVPIFPQLREILEAYLDGPFAPTGKLLFPGAGEDGEQMITDLRRALNCLVMPARLLRDRTPAEFQAAEKDRVRKLNRLQQLAAGKQLKGPAPTESLEELLEPTSEQVVPPLRWTMVRHTYCSARLQSLHAGEPVSPFTVIKEMGHADQKMIMHIYGHLGTIVHRREGVEYI